MPTIDVSDIVVDPDLSQNFTIARTTGILGMGGFQAGMPQTLTLCGTITVATEKELAILPQADRPKGAMAIYTPSQIFVTEPAGASPAQFRDMLTWRGDQYSIIAVKQWVDFGYYLGIAVRLGGQV